MLAPSLAAPPPLASISSFRGAALALALTLPLVLAARAAPLLASISSFCEPAALAGEESAETSYPELLSLKLLKENMLWR